MVSGTPPTARSFRARACDNCRIRKIKCDKISPCSSCGTLGIPCRPVGTPSTAPDSPRSNTPNDYEQRFSALQEQLATIQKTLERIICPSSSSGPIRPVQEPTPSGPTIPPFEGHSSFHHETLVARDAAYSAADTSHNSQLGDYVSAALASLKTNLDKHRASVTQGETQTATQPKEILLPVELVVAVVKKVKAQPPFTLVSQSWFDATRIETLCHSIYFPLEPVPAGTFALFYGLFYYIIRDYLHAQDPDLGRYNLSSALEICETQLDAGLASPTIMIDPTLEKIQALLIGVTKSQEEFDIQRCWTYLSLAFNMCQTMGLHRRTALRNDPLPTAEAKRHAFWALYTIDKNISLNIGLTSHFQDHDIDAELFTPSEDPKQRPWDLMSVVRMEFATIQGRVYDQLYSTSAFRASDEQRAAAIEKLSSDLEAVRDKLLAIDVSMGLYADSLHGIAACADFIAYSVLTVIYRAQTRPGDAMAISSRCYEIATLALHSHLKCFTYFRGRQTHKQTEYVNWILLYPSFTPFIIVFTHAITTASAVDLALLQDTVSSLELIKGLSRGSLHLYTVCEAFVKAAQVLVKSRQTLSGIERHQDGSLVMPAADGATNIAFPNVSWPEDTFDSLMNQTDISMFLNDFIGANRSVMDILSSDYMS
ncbi:transcription factor domain-containing protein [Aspergillus saccharolyticus JOP 1030-1]|uniref:C6 transcription factor n=1 Tax=Aspergillus saccharolyticus JOP 1030-1 TaxID=1450539 RepID=A0A318ZSG4_9EURO|nr:C6 transcription factor [Aspergillus saccharolyticus JOP 1030-1]PYH49584.1 C6 transcription factor [Aspergillus saccharolyticus JOP 1030-1]